MFKMGKDFDDLYHSLRETAWRLHNRHWRYIKRDLKRIKRISFAHTKAHRSVLLSEHLAPSPSPKVTKQKMTIWSRLPTQSHTNSLLACSRGLLFIGTLKTHVPHPNNDYSQDIVSSVLVLEPAGETLSFYQVTWTD